MSSKSITQAVPEYYKRYGLYTNKEKMIPALLDGLLPVHRRIILCTYMLGRSGWVKTRNVLGEVVGKYHPHNLDKGPFTWCVQNEFIDGNGSWGCRAGIDGIESAADRYTSVKSNKFIEKLAFEFINDIEWKLNDLDHEEPEFLPTMLPLSLLGNYNLMTIATGAKPRLPCYSIEHLIKRLLYLTNQGPKFIPIPKIEGCKILSKPSELEELCTTGKGKIDVTGLYSVDKVKSIIRIHGWNPTTTFNAILNKIDKYKNKNLITNAIVGYNDDSCGKTDVRFEILKRNNKDENFKLLVDAIEDALVSSINYEVYAVHDDKFRIYSIDEFLTSVYTNYMKCFSLHLNNKIVKTQKDIDSLNIVSKIKPHISTLSNHKEIEKSYKDLSKLTGVDFELIKEVCGRYRISTLLSLNTDTNDLEKLKKEYNVILKNIETETLNKYKNLLEK